MMVKLPAPPSTPPSAFADRWYTLICCDPASGEPVAVAQVITPGAAHALVGAWAQRYPAQATVVFDPSNQPLALDDLARLSNLERLQEQQGDDARAHG